MSEEKNIPREETPLEQPVNKEPPDEANSFDEPIAEAEQQQTINLSSEALSKEDNQPQTEKDMEVHHHTHAAHGKKTWKDYFWEFLMLFLAVFCGFLAEYQLEHVIENQREKKYMESLLSDLKTDLATIDYGLPRKEGKTKAIDTVFMFFNTNKNVTSIPGKLFKTIRRTTWDQRIDRNTITISQLKNAGNMRLVKKKAVADSIAAYDMQWTYIDLYRDAYLMNGQLSNRYAEKLVNPNDLLTLYIDNSSEAIVANIPDSIFININTIELKEQLNFMMGQKVNIRQQFTLYMKLRQSAEQLIELIKKEYHLK